MFKQNVNKKPLILFSVKQLEVDGNRVKLAIWVSENNYSFYLYISICHQGVDKYPCPFSPECSTQMNLIRTDIFMY